MPSADRWQLPTTGLARSTPTDAATLPELIEFVDGMVEDAEIPDEVVPILGHLIRAADPLIALLPVNLDGMEPALFDFLRVARQVRQKAYALIAQYDLEQAWFWTEEWQRGERQADADKEAGRVTRFVSDEAFVAALKARRPNVAYS